MQTIFNKIKHKHLYKKAITYFKEIDYSVYIEASNKVQSYCINEEYEFHGIKAYHHRLPLKDLNESYLSKDNWDLTNDEINEIKRCLETLDEYRDALCNICFYNKNGVLQSIIKQPFINEVLPPWVIFPLYDAMTIGWRMGFGEEYMEIFISYLETLSDEQKKMYFKTYPVPKYMECNKFYFNYSNHALRTKNF